MKPSLSQMPAALLLTLGLSGPTYGEASFHHGSTAPDEDLPTPNEIVTAPDGQSAQKEIQTRTIKPVTSTKVPSPNYRSTALDSGEPAEPAATRSVMLFAPQYAEASAQTSSVVQALDTEQRRFTNLGFRVVRADNLSGKALFEKVREDREKHPFEYRQPVSTFLFSEETVDAGETAKAPSSDDYYFEKTEDGGAANRIGAVSEVLEPLKAAVGGSSPLTLLMPTCRASWLARELSQGVKGVKGGTPYRIAPLPPLKAAKPCNENGAMWFQKLTKN